MINSAHTLTRDPEGTFREPNALLERTDLDLSEKLVILQSWHADLTELLKATEENMASASPEVGANATRLAQVSNAIAYLEEKLGKPR